MLHVLLHMASDRKSYTSEQLAQMLSTNPVVVRRTMSGLREAGFVISEKGRSGGWSLVEHFEQLTLMDIYQAVGNRTFLRLVIKIAIQSAWSKKRSIKSWMMR